MMAIGVVHLEEGAQRWKRWMMATNCLLATYQYCVSVVAVLLVLQNGKGAFALIWSVAAVVSFTICNVKARVLQHYLGVIREVGRFVDGKPGYSGDAEFDLAVRHEVFKTMRKMFAAIYGNCFCVQVIMAMPIEQIQRLFGTPEEFGELGPVVAQLASSAALLLKPFIWMSRLFSGTVTFTGLLVALNAEMKIVRHGFEGVMDRVSAAINEDIGQGGSLNKRAEQKMFWKNLNVNVKLLVDQHIEILR
nr:uncharacterized protein LOC109411343 [Aedes albopictus]